jgi:hypothetical protein
MKLVALPATAEKAPQLRGAFRIDVHRFTLCMGAAPSKRS